METISATTNKAVYFLIVGSGTEYYKVENWFYDQKPKNASLLAGLPKQDYDLLLNACDVGLIFLHKAFSIPNFPSRLLSYLEMRIPVIAATDSNTDIGDVIENNQCGCKVISGDSEKMRIAIDMMISDETKYNQMKENAWTLLQKEYLVDRSYNLIKDKVNV